MKISHITTSTSNLKVFKPIQYLYLTGHGVGYQQLSEITLRVRIVNSMTGRVDEIIPSVNLGVLSEISSMNEGFSVIPGVFNDTFKMNIMLHPTSAIYLSNDKYLEVDINGMEENGLQHIHVYGIESNVVDKDFVCRYNKFYMSAGELQKTFAVGENENLIIPTSSFDEVTLQYNNGSSCTYTLDELGALMILKNDIVSVPRDNIYYSVIAKDSNAENCCLSFGYRNLFGLDVSEVVDFTIKRSQSDSAFEVIMIDTIKE